MKVGALEILVILLVALLVLGPDRLPKAARRLGASLSSVKQASSELTQELSESVSEVEAPLQEAMAPLDEFKQDVRKDLRSMEKELSRLENPAPEEEFSLRYETPAARPAEPVAEQPETEKR